MKVTIKKLSVLKHPEKNVRIHSEQQIRELKRSLEKFGQTRALVIDENNIILIGNGLYEAMVSLGYQEATVYVKAGLSENDKKKLMIADNKTYALGIDNLETLNEFLEELQGIWISLDMMKKFYSRWSLMRMKLPKNSLSMEL